MSIHTIMECVTISVKGIVQGVGFRPFVHALACRMGVKGYVTNTAEGVFISAEGSSLHDFIESIRKEAPPLSKIMDMEISPAVFNGYTDFSIRESAGRGTFTLISPDMSVCSDCLEEMFDSNDRRFLYPFINCTNCGPRYSITRAVPYDRENTTMRPFSMCRDCGREYHDPGARRFHAQPNACPECGPGLELRIRGQEQSTENCMDPAAKTIELLKQGKIIAVKGLGGFHLVCDALNEDAVAALRERKRKSNKPFALMAGGIRQIREFCDLPGPAEELLGSVKRPVLLLAKRHGCPLPEAVAPRNRYLGFMLPYTPLHYLLFYHPGYSSDNRQAETPWPDYPHFAALVMTSGNMSEEPIVIDNDEAVTRLKGLCDAVLLHNRDIFMRVDDSVLKISSGANEGAVLNSWYMPSPVHAFFIRRSRGYAPEPISLAEEGPDVLGCGADLKNTLTITKGSYAIPSQHMGDMENYETLAFFEETLRNLTQVYRSEPVAAAYDLHPAYLSTRWALSYIEKSGGKLQGHAVQHHHAHIASVMAEKGIRDKVIGVAFDGTGYGGDGTLWGGEFFIADTFGFRRAGHIEYIPLPGGETAIREPWRTAVSCLSKAAGEEIWDFIGPTGFIGRYGREKIEQVLHVAGQPAFSPLSSGAGRLFDAVAALIGVCDTNTYEGEAAIALESLVSDDVSGDYPVDIRFSDPMVVDFSMTILSILEELRRNTHKEVISTKFHNTVISAIVNVVLKLSATFSIRRSVLSGGVFQNLYLLEQVRYALHAAGLECHVNEAVPANDAGISLGQAYIVRERIRSGMPRSEKP